MNHKYQELACANLRSKAQALFHDETFWIGRPIIGLFAKEERALIHDVAHCVTLGRRNGFSPIEGIECLALRGGRGFSRWLFEQHSAFTGIPLQWDDERCCASNPDVRFWEVSDLDEIEATGLTLAIMVECGEVEVRALAEDAASGPNGFIPDYVHRVLSASERCSQPIIDRTLRLVHWMLRERPPARPTPSYPPATTEPRAAPRPRKPPR